VEFEVQLDPQHLETLTKATPLTGITELIWNALDADATEVRVALPENELGGVVEIRVEDNGHGMTQEQALAGFERLGGSWKRTATQSPQGRTLHGRDGRGRFRAARSRRSGTDHR
jgi:glucose-6-phosphate-specific signal transduction histidine kinase